MNSDPRGNSKQTNEDFPLEDLPARSADQSETVATGGVLGASSRPGANVDDDVILIEDLTPRENVKGGRKVILGEVATRPEERK